MNLAKRGMRRMMLIAWIASCTLVVGSAVRAQEGSESGQKDQKSESTKAEKKAESTKPDQGFGESLTVTAEKRAEQVEKIPMSITVLPGDQLQREKVKDFADLTAVVPGLSIETTQPGVTRLTLRGINTEGVAATVGVYVDDIPYGSSTGLANGSILSGDFDTFDLQRIEVLRGPQGTLYGASSLGGVLKYVPNPPSTEVTEARVQGGVDTVDGGQTGYSAAAVVNKPINDKFALRVSGYSRLDGGFIDSIGNNPIPSLLDPSINIISGTQVKDNLDEVKKSGGRLAALFKPSDRFSINFEVLLQKIDSDAPHTVDANPVTLEPIYGDRVQSRYQSQFSNIDYKIYSATLNWDLGGATLHSVTSYSTFKQDEQTDSAYATTLTGGPPLASLVTYLFGDATSRPLSVILPEVVTTDKTTQEFRLVSPENDSLEWLIGAYYTYEDSGIGEHFYAVDAGTDNVATDLPSLADVSLDSTYKEYALFAHATWHVAPRFDLSFGGRTSKNDQEASQVADGPLVGGLTAYQNTKSSEHPFTYSISPRFEFGPRSSIYARVATGFRPGGPNVLPPSAPSDTPSTYKSDRLTDYEIGVKSTSSNGKFSLDLATFYLDWTDIQLLAVVNNFGINANGGKAVSKGVEFTFGFRPVTGLLLSINGAYTDAYLTQDTDPVVGGMNGDPLPWVPDWSYGLHGDYAWPVKDNWVAHLGGSVNYTGNRTADFNNRTADGSIRPIDSFTTLNLNTGIDFGQWSLELYAKNLSNEMGITSVDTGGFLPNGAVNLGLIRPRSIGLTAGLRW